MEIVKYTKEYEHLMSKFDCGNIVINNFLKSHNALDENQGITYIMLSDEKDAIIGYYNIEVGRIDMFEEVNGEFIYSPMGGSGIINYLGVQNEFQRTQLDVYNGRKIYFGDVLLLDCEDKICDLRKHIGMAFITINSTEQGCHLYRRNDYVDFEDDMSIVVRESDIKGYKLYKCIDDIA